MGGYPQRNGNICTSRIHIGGTKAPHPDRLDLVFQRSYIQRCNINGEHRNDSYDNWDFVLRKNDLFPLKPKGIDIVLGHGNIHQRDPQPNIFSTRYRPEINMLRSIKDYELRLNLPYEVGVAHALGKQVILITQ